MNHRASAILLVGLAALPAPALGQLQEERVFTVESPPLLALEGHSGDVRVRRGSAGRVRVRYVREDEGIEVRMIHVGRVVAIATTATTESGRVDFEIEFPARGDVDLRSVGGALQVEGIRGRLDLRSTRGTLTATDCAGELYLTLTNGDIRLSGIGEAAVEASSVAGTISYRHGSLAGGPYTFSTTTGATTISHGADASYSVSGSTRGAVLVTVPGIEVHTPGPVPLREIRGTYGSGLARLTLRTSIGDIALELDR